MYVLVVKGVGVDIVRFDGKRTVEGAVEVGEVDFYVKYNRQVLYKYIYSCEQLERRGVAAMYIYIPSALKPSSITQNKNSCRRNSQSCVY